MCVAFEVEMRLMTTIRNTPPLVPLQIDVEDIALRFNFDVTLSCASFDLCNLGVFFFKKNIYCFNVTLSDASFDSSNTEIVAFLPLL